MLYTGQSRKRVYHRAQGGDRGKNKFQHSILEQVCYELEILLNNGYHEGVSRDALRRHSKKPLKSPLKPFQGAGGIFPLQRH